MKTVFFKIWLIIGGVLLSSNCTAQTLDTLLATAETNNLVLKIAAQNYEIALLKRAQVSQLPAPEIGIGVYPLPVETRLGAQLLRGSVTQTFPWFGTLSSKAALEDAKAGVVYERLTAERLELFYQLKVAYLQVYELEQQQALVRQRIRLFKSLEQLALTKIESGTTSATDALRVQMKLEELEQQLKILEVAKINPTATLNQLLNRPLQTVVIVTDSLEFANLLLPQDTLMAYIQQHHPQLKTVERQQEIARQAMAVNKLEGRPSFGIGLDYIMVDQRRDATPVGNGRDILQIRAAVKVPIYRKKYKAKQAEEELKIAALDHQKEEVLTSFQTTIAKAYATHQTTRLQLELYNKQTLLLQTTIRMLTTEYSTQGSNFETLLQLEQELLNYELKQLQAIVQSHLAKSSIERFIVQ